MGFFFFLANESSLIGDIEITEFFTLLGGCLLAGVFLRIMSPSSFEVSLKPVFKKHYHLHVLHMKIRD